MTTTPSNPLTSHAAAEPRDDSARDSNLPHGGAVVPAHQDGLLESIGKAISAPLRDDPGTDVDEKPDAPAAAPPRVDRR